MQLTVSQFLNRPLDALSFYDILPTDGLSLVDRPLLAPAGQIVERLCAADADIAEEVLNEALLVLLDAPLIDPILAETAAGQLSRLYAGLLAGGKRDRARRMKLQQLNFFLRDILDRDAIALACSMPVAGGSPWDWLPMPQGEAMIFSGVNGLRWSIDGASGSADVGFPSQLDRIDNNRISVGSIFTPGAAILEHGRITEVAHQRPVVLIFDQTGEDWAVCYDGAVVNLGDGSVKLRLDLDQVDRVRLIDGQLLASDWSKPGTILSCVPASGQQNRIAVEPIILLNDICRVNDRYYAICKQQGRVFAFDKSFNCVGTRLSFGRTSGRLFDPLTIRFHEGELHVLNWVTATRVTLPLF